MKFSIIFVCALFTMLVSIAICYYISIHFFFDKLFYRKSAAFGYHEQAWNIITVQQKAKTLSDRTNDLAALIDLESNKDNKPTDPSDSTFKIALIGDSFVYGTGIKTQERFGQLLEDRLNKMRKTKVYFLAQPGDNIIDNYAKFKAAEQFIPADLYIFTMVDNDLYFENQNKYPEVAEITADLQKRCPGQLFSSSVQAHQIISKGDGHSETDLYYLPSFSDSFQNSCYLKMIGEDVAHSGKSTLFFSFSAVVDNPPEALDSENSKENLMIWKYASTVKNTQNTVIDATRTPGFLFTPVSKMEGHPSAETNRYYANALYEEITKNPKWKF